MKAIYRGRVVAESDDTVVVEGNHYFPRTAVDATVLTDSETTSFCGWKGAARYHHVTVDGNTAKDAAWYYPDPKPEAAAVTDRVAFWNGVEIVGEAGD